LPFFALKGWKKVFGRDIKTVVSINFSWNFFSGGVSVIEALKLALIIFLTAR
jgi:hypothetical protein